MRDLADVRASARCPFAVAGRATWRAVQRAVLRRRSRAPAAYRDGGRGWRPLAKCPAVDAFSTRRVWCGAASTPEGVPGVHGALAAQANRRIPGVPEAVAGRRGPFVGAMTLALSAICVLRKLRCEVTAEIWTRQVGAIQATGAAPTQVPVIRVAILATVLVSEGVSARLSPAAYRSAGRDRIGGRALRWRRSAAAPRGGSAGLLRPDHRAPAGAVPRPEA